MITSSGKRNKGLTNVRLSYVKLWRTIIKLLSMTKNMRIVVVNLEKFHRDRVFVDPDQDKDLGTEDTSGSSKRTRESTKKKSANLP